MYVQQQLKPKNYIAKVLSLSLNACEDGAFLTSNGSSFHSIGAHDENVRLP